LRPFQQQQLFWLIHLPPLQQLCFGDSSRSHHYSSTNNACSDLRNHPFCASRR
jgi:hypothetical protein